MTRGKCLVGLAVVTGALMGATATMRAQSPQGQQQPSARPGREQLPQPVYRVAQQVPDANAIAANTNSNLPQQPEAVAQQEHPLVPALQIAYAAIEQHPHQHPRLFVHDDQARADRRQAERAGIHVPARAARAV